MNVFITLFTVAATKVPVVGASFFMENFVFYRMRSGVAQEKEIVKYVYLNSYGKTEAYNP